MFENAIDDKVASEPRPRFVLAPPADVAPVPPSEIASVPVIEDAPKLIANSVDSITKPPLDFRSVLNVVPVKSRPSPAE